MTRQRKLTALLAVAVAAVAVATLLAASPVFGHARYKASTPGRGEVLAASPARVEITFTEQIQKVSGAYSIEVTRDRGAAITAGPAVVDESDRTKMSVGLQAGLGPGRYVVNWTNTSDDDGDPIHGGFSFYIDSQPNAVDLANDQQLAQIGFEDVTAAAAGATPPPGATSPANTPAPATTRPVATAPAPTPSITDTGGESDDTSRYFIIAAVIVGLIIGFGAWQYLSRRRT